MARFIVLLGPPGAGKGTQAKRISKNLEMPHISSGDIFRENIKNETGLGMLAAMFMNAGNLVPDDVTISMIKERLSRPDCAAGAILDGFPRTPAQAQALGTMLPDIDGEVCVVPYIKVDEDILIERLTGRWTCKNCGHIYHQLYSPPKVEGICDFDGSELYQREDDNLETVSYRIQVYHEQTQPLIDYYSELGSLVEIDGSKPIEMVTEELLGALKPFREK